MVSNKLIQGNDLKVVKVTLDYTESVVCRLRFVCAHNFKTFLFRQLLIYSIYDLYKIYDRKLLLFKWKTPIKTWLRSPSAVNDNVTAHFLSHWNDGDIKSFQWLFVRRLVFAIRTGVRRFHRISQ